MASVERFNGTCIWLDKKTDGSGSYCRLCGLDKSDSCNDCYRYQNTFNP